MGKITSVRAYANNEVAYIAWDIRAKIKGCLGFEITRIYLDGNGKETGERVKCAAWVPFKGQRNRYWLPQDTGVCPYSTAISIMIAQLGAARREGDVLHPLLQQRP